jgi:hypothetical protein
MKARLIVLWALAGGSIFAALLGGYFGEWP